MPVILPSAMLFVIRGNPETWRVYMQTFLLLSQEYLTPYGRAVRLV